VKRELDLFKSILSHFSNSEPPERLGDTPWHMLTINNVSYEMVKYHIELLIEQECLRESAIKLNAANHCGQSAVVFTADVLTNKGHDFANTLENNEVFTKLKTEFKNAPFKVVFDGGQKLLSHYFKKKIDQLTEE
jgi:hypothetical protein